MKSYSIQIAAVAAAVLCTVQLWAQSPNNPLDVALLRWYPGDISALFTANLGPSPDSLAFDGSNIWVTNPFSGLTPGYVTKLRASDGACVGTCSFVVGTAPNWLAFDGANVWVSNVQDGTVTKLLASTGHVVGTYSVGGPSAAAGGVAFDGTYIWVANQTPSTVTKLQASTGAIVGVFQLGPSTNTPFGVAFDGANIWVGYGQGSHLPAAGVYKL
jgi:hypothetical protein